jgi:lycopene beta-cyclase
VIFNNRRRELPLSYATISSPRLDAVLRAALQSVPGCLLKTSATVDTIAANEVLLTDGSKLTARVVIDSRGPVVSQEARPACGFQKFLGLDVLLEEPTSLTQPILMDATVPQRDGFRFFYVLPFRPDLLLIEDTYYSDNRSFDGEALKKEVLGYAQQKGWKIKEVLREERGILPLPFVAGPPPLLAGPLIAGCQGGWFHPATSYSFPIALRLADYVASASPEELFGDRFAALCAAHREQEAFCHRLNWLLFRGAPEGGRWRIMSAFYTHPQDTLQRFYSMSLNAGDRSRILRTGAMAFMSAWVRGG